MQTITSTETQKQIRILHLEDDPNDAELVMTLLLDHDLPVLATRVQTEQEFRETLQQWEFDIIISDFSLPAYDGISALRVAQEICPEIPFIFVSGTIGEESAINSLLEGATDYVLKHRMERLVPAVRRAMREVEERKTRNEAEKALRESEERFRMLFTASPDAILLVDPTDTNVSWPIIECNDAACRMNGRTRDEIIGSSISLFDASPAPEAVRAQFLEQLKATGVVLIERRQRHKDGSIVPVELSISTVNYEGRDLMLAIARDISERKRSELEVRRSREWLQAILDASRDGIVAEQNEIIVYANHAFARIHGYESLSDLIGKSITTVHAPEDRKRMREVDTAPTGKHSTLGVYEFSIKRRDGSKVEVEAYQSSAKIGGESFVITTVRDITERNLLQHQVAVAQKMEGIGVLAGGVAHDFNNILGIIMGHSTLLEASVTPPEKWGDSLRTITQASRRGATLVRQLLTFARKTEAASEVLNVNALTREIEGMLSGTFQKSIVVTTDLDHSIPSIVGDASQLHQVLLNLAVNARDAMPKGGKLTIRTSLVTAARVAELNKSAVDRDHILVEVLDTGTGMNESTRQKIFEPFFTTKGPGKGTGLGLPVVFGIVNQLRGFIDVESTIGVGTSFSVYLPIPDSETLSHHGKITQEFPVRKGSETVLIIEDEDLLRDLVDSLLTSMGYSVLTADDGLKGLALFKRKRHSIGLVISDFGLPGIDGLEVVKRIREIDTNMNVIIASGFVDPEVKAALKIAGVRDFIQKPYSRSEILTTVGKVLDRKQ